MFCALCFACNADSQTNNTTVIVQDQEAPADWSITTKVKAKIIADTELSASARLVSVTTTNGIVTLEGTVPTAADRDRIVAIAKSVDGVVGVNMKMTVSDNSNGN
ncbi:MAG: BON domain-containing protein [Chlamydiota bacterium]